jgi:tRNA A37 methylthiotransferase MiaB
MTDHPAPSRMRRGYTREAYLDLIDRARQILPSAAISSDFISGFCGETDEEHRDTVMLMERVGFDQAFMFAYSMREKTPAHRKFQCVAVSCAVFQSFDSYSLPLQG